jgi:hypothetical protein
MHKNKLFFFLLFASLLCNAQNDYEIKGKIADKFNKQKLPYSIISIAHHAIGTVSNFDGEFILKISQKHLKDTLFISYLGYHTFKAPVADYFNKEANIFLEHQEISLNEVRITATSALDLLRIAVLKIPANYETTPVWIQAFYRQIVMEDTVITENSEIVLDIYKQPYIQTKQIDSCELVKGRHQEKEHTLGFISGINSTLQTDLVKYPKYFLSEINFKSYNYILEEITHYNNNEVYVISFDQKDNLRESLYKGKICLDVNSLAFIKIEYSISPKGIKYWKSKAKDELSLKMFTGCSIHRLSVNNVLNYENVNGKWHLNNLQIFGTQLVNCKKGKKQFIQTYHSELVVTKIDKDNKRKVDKAKLINPHLPLKLQVGNLDEKFWGSYNIIK